MIGKQEVDHGGSVLAGQSKLDATAGRDVICETLCVERMIQ